MMKSSRGINYQLEGQENAPVLIFSNSLGTDLTMWNAQAAFFSKNFRVLRYDTRGHGQSEVISEQFTVADLAQDLLALMDELKITKAHFCGISIGGFTGIWLGHHHPERFYSLTLANTAPKIATADIWETRIALVEKEGLAPVAASSAQRWFTSQFIQEYPEEAQRLAENLTKTSAQAYIACCRILRDTDLWNLLPRITLPTLVLAGENDKVCTTTEAQQMVETIKDSQLAIIPASHLSNLEGAAFTSALEHFLHKQSN